jgi:hypothetical protein
MKSNTHRRSIRLVAGGAVTVMAVIGTVLPAGASVERKQPKPKPPAIVLSSTGTFTLGSDGAAAVTGTGEVNLHGSDTSKPVVVSATLSADDGTLPAPETCEPAVATVSFRVPHHKVTTTLFGRGQVCGVYPQLPTYIVTHVFTGNYDVIAGKPRLVGTDGWFEIRLAQDGSASASAYDS